MKYNANISAVILIEFRLLKIVCGWIFFFSSVQAKDVELNKFLLSMDTALCSKLVLTNLVEEMQVEVLQKENIMGLLHF